MTNCRDLGCEYCDSWGRQVDGQATVTTEAFEVAMLLFSFGELSVCPNTRVGATGFWGIRRCSEVVANFSGVEVKAGCLFQPEGVAFLPWHSQ